MGWGRIKNGALLMVIEHKRIDVFLAGDRNMRERIWASC